VPIAAIGVVLAWLWTQTGGFRNEKLTPGMFTPEDLLATYDGQDLSKLSEGELKMRQLAIDAIAQGVGKYPAISTVGAYVLMFGAVALAIAIFTGML
jgi:hypothetical protein